MFAKIGRKLVQGAKAEIEESPPVIFDQDRIFDLLEAVVAFGTLAIVLFGGGKSKQPVTVVVNNYVNGVQQ